ncbi:hypothetical protein ACJRO7_026907, partial [Eucalyptus globulus]
RLEVWGDELHSAKCPWFCMEIKSDQVCDVHGSSYAHSSAEFGRDRSSNCSSQDFP